MIDINLQLFQLTVDSLNLEGADTADFLIKYHQIAKYVARVLFSLLSPESLIPFDALTCSGAFYEACFAVMVLVLSLYHK